jgi:hypothetical protein
VTDKTHPSLAEISADPAKYLSGPEGMLAVAAVVRANIIAVGEEKAVPPWLVAVMAQIGMILAEMGKQLANERLAVIALTIDTPPRMH